jgi:signal peptidase I
MTSLQEAAPPSPWISVWLRPRQTIENILARQPRRSVWLLASLGAASSLLPSLLAGGAASLLTDWHALLGLAVICAVIGIGNLYIGAFVYKWIGRLFGGRASAADLRAALAWSAMPNILGLIVILAIVVASRFDSVGLTQGPFSPLLPAIVLLFALWAIVVLMLMLSRIQGFGFWRTVVAYVLAAILSLVLALGIAVSIRTLLYQPFSTPSRSMEPTLLEGDYFFVSKYAYGYTHYSIPFSPSWFAGRVFGSEPKRGDVAVFRVPKDVTTDYVKRVIGLPGDRIQVKEGALYINDTPVAREQLADFVGNDPCGSDAVTKTKRWRETLPNGVSYETLDCVANGFYDNTNVLTVPAGHYFVLGDNRDNSTDSRVVSFGSIPLENFIGRTGIMFFSRDVGLRGAPATVRAERIGTMVH